MNDSYVPDGEMDPRELTDKDIDALIDGRPIEGSVGELNDLVTALRAEYQATPPVPVGTALGEFLEVVDLTATPASVHVRPSRRSKMLTGVGAFVATTTGKILLGTAIAAASVGGAHVAEVIDVPGFPDYAKTPTLVSVDESAPEIQDVVAHVVEPTAAIHEDVTDAEDDAADDGSNHGEEVSDFATTTDLEGCERGQAIAEIASSNADEHRQNPDRDHNPCDKPDKDDPDGETAEDTVAEPEDGAADDGSNHGEEVSDFATTTDLEGCERGQAIAEIASSNADEHRQNPDRDHNPCDKPDKDDPDDPDGETAEDTVAEPEDDAADDGSNHGEEVSNFATTTDLEGCERGQAIAEIASSNADEHRQNPDSDDGCDEADPDEDGEDDKDDKDDKDDNGGGGSDHRDRPDKSDHRDDD